MEKTTTYIVITSNGRDEWILYEDTNLEEAKRAARHEFRLNEMSKQKYTVELREMVNEYDYNLVEFIDPVRIEVQKG